MSKSNLLTLHNISDLATKRVFMQMQTKLDNMRKDVQKMSKRIDSLTKEVEANRRNTNGN